ncbi:MAG: ribonuclease P protein component [Deltaproteobacteria bacterium GWA2_38_16]|nr:MAG: ribonuclease P protein component [Deltaproteobacteria bacterium GWA2_38_16]OGQ01769.1 MAG: ribonuclease P protein component [Deltaproteobacteria bacterium RIFCSPHIGHO2_02_FULL_38_15]OGQ34584.1 MAG: ribonuclease P protein component [Deltaproteobacteria bacterium RIFCSPLOWO2_01_FULL_38_9]OGQ59441.1 MAG: ribonuclease P protein component [Deltaproteobacteria bacterium RIFCSPLOWO2_12_FULL_38_8]HBQ21427.1 ribonuclease P protein component [Deltaproteobacteria bacterium]
MPKAQFTKQQRLLKQNEFQYTLKCGVRQETTHFIVFFSKNDCETHRLGIIVSRKVGNAVIRNRIKRVAREYFRQFNTEHLFKNSFYDIVLIGKKNLNVNLGLEQVCKEMQSVYEKNPYWFYHDVSMDVGRAIA